MTVPDDDPNLDGLDEELPYRLRDQFLSSPEVMLYRILRDLVRDRYVVFARVALDEIFSIVRPNENVHFFHKIFRKHIDFLLCDSQIMSPQIGVQLVRANGATTGRNHDRFMENLFSSAGMPLVQVPISDRYEAADVVELFRTAVAKVKSAEGRPARKTTEPIPMCPVCGKMMVLRTHRTGPFAGQLYYGCIDNPACPGRVLVRAVSPR